MTYIAWTSMHLHAYTTPSICKAKLYSKEKCLWQTEGILTAQL